MTEIDAGRRAAIETLLGTIWTRLPEVIPRARRWGAAWEAMSRPFVTWEGNEPIAHVGLMPTRLLVAGRAIEVGAIHAVCTREDRRRRGLATKLVREALDASDAMGHRAQILYAVDPEFYARFGFRPLGTYVHVGGAPRPTRKHEAATLDPDRPEDLALVHEYLARRAPTSDAFFVIEPSALFLLDYAIQKVPDRHLVHVASLDAILVYRLVDDLLYVEDVVAPTLPSLEDIVAAVPSRVRNVVVHFGNDRLRGPGLQADLWGDVDTLMVRGSIFDDEPRLAIPPLARW